MSKKLLEKIRSRGHWQVVARPQKYISERIPSLSDCLRLIEESQVRCRGWYFPHFDSSEVLNGLNYIESGTDFPAKYEAWRFYQSGQFAFLGALGEDWLEEHPFLTKEERSRFAPGEHLNVLSTLYRLSEIYEFVSRLAQAGIFDDHLVLSIELVGTKGRRMVFWDPGRYLGKNCICIEESLPKERTFAVADFISNAREYALQHFLWIAERFQVDASVSVFRRDQEKFFEGRF